MARSPGAWRSIPTRCLRRFASRTAPKPTSTNRAQKTGMRSIASLRLGTRWLAFRDA